MKTNIVFLGPPGCGKGTQAALLKERLSLCHISTGELLRQEIQHETPLGLLVKEEMNQGRYAPESIVLEILVAYLARHAHEKGFIFDGFPRTLSQAEWFETFLASQGETLKGVIYFAIHEEILIKRLSGRFTCAVCGATYNEYFKKPHHEGACDVCGSHEFSRRADDTADRVAERLRVYHEQTKPLLPFYQKKGLLREIDVTRSVTEVSSEILAAVIS
jgi:adenylate kinase